MNILRRVSQAAVLLALVLVISAGTTVYNVRKDSEGLRASLTQLQDAYRLQSPPLLRQLLEQPSLTDDERTETQKILTEFQRAPHTPDLQQDTQQLSATLKDLRHLLVQMAGNEEIASTESFSQLKALSYGTGPMVPLFHDYNQGVLIWNQRDRSTVGHFVASTLRLEKILMVNPDGSSEFVPTINF